MPLLSKISRVGASKATHLGGALYAAGSAAYTNYKEHRPPEKAIEAHNAAGGTASISNIDGRKQPGEQTEIYEILSSLIQAVYATDRGKKDASLFYEALGYEQENLEAYVQDEHPEKDMAAVGNSACKIRLMVFRRRDLADLHDLVQEQDHPDVSETATKAKALPKYVVAIRGTRKYCQRDIVADIQILFETLHHNPLYDIVKNMTRRVVEKHSHDTVCVAGHSLGAAIALIVTRELALEDMPVETHLFNPPFFSLETLVEKVTTLGSKGLSKLGLGQAFKEGSEGLSSSLQSTRLMKLVKAKKTKRDAEYLEAMAPEFTKLRKWTPQLYVNPYDPICNGYIHYFRNQNLFYGGPETLAISLTSGSLRRLTKLDSYSYHLIPSANLHINHRGDKNLLESHPLHQWHDYPAVDLQHEQHDLLEEFASEKAEDETVELVAELTTLHDHSLQP